jgi:hypothetical protein
MFFSLLYIFINPYIQKRIAKVRKTFDSASP